MGMNLNMLVFSLVVTTTTAAFAGPLSDYETKYLTISKVKVNKISTDVLNQEVSVRISEKNFPQGLPDSNGNPDPTQEVGKIISTGRDLVALGEDIYRLVVKGKPTVTTTYAPISVVPKINGEIVDILSTEGWALPQKTSYEVAYENLFGMTVVKFRYSVIFSHDGSFDGKGAYITGAQIIPELCTTLFGYDFNATMKLGGIQNNGTKKSPVAGATLLLEYAIKTIVKAETRVESFFITGKGSLKRL